MPLNPTLEHPDAQANEGAAMAGAGGVLRRTVTLAPLLPPAARASDAVSSPILTPDRLYELELSAPQQITVPPGRRGGSAPHKIVEFPLPAATRLTLQVDADAASTVKVAVSLLR